MAAMLQIQKYHDQLRSLVGRKVSLQGARFLKVLCFVAGRPRSRDMKIEVEVKGLLSQKEMTRTRAGR